MRKAGRYLRMRRSTSSRDELRRPAILDFFERRKNFEKENSQPIFCSQFHFQHSGKETIQNNEKQTIQNNEA